MRVLVDKYIPFLNGVLDTYAEVCFLEPEAFTPQTVKNADALIIRTRTKCDAALLEGSAVRFIATATIGTDHIDFDFCCTRGIEVVSCPGCNAQGVCDYVEEVLRYAQDTGMLTQTGTIGIVGVGHVGSLVSEMAHRRGMHVLLNDPPKGLGVPLEQIAEEADVVTFHTPLTDAGDWPTFHLCDASCLAHTKPEALIINAARGGVVDEQALLRSGRPFVLDTWEGEPHINSEVLLHARLASMHIAGYTVQGKRNASQTCLNALCAHFGLPACMLADEQLPQGDTGHGWLERISRELKNNPDAFEQLRKKYKLR